VEEQHHDVLPEDLDITGLVGPYTFPNINRRRVPGMLYLAIALACFVLWVVNRGDDHVLVNSGFLVVAVFLGLVGAYHVVAGWNLDVTDTDALVAAVKRVGFPVGHASAQLGWRGQLSPPTWRIQLYSAEDPPARRGLVLVDGVDGSVLAELVEENPEDWSELSG
jgi:hypothetical protein